MIYMNNEEFQKLCDRLQIEKGARISYLQFLARFEQRDTAEGHKILISDHRLGDCLNLNYIFFSIIYLFSYSLLLLNILKRTGNIFF